MIGFVVAALGGVSMSAANPPWNPGGRTGEPTGVVAIKRPPPPALQLESGIPPNDCQDTLPDSGDAIADFVNGPEFMCVISRY